jgi:hypothetical protein
MTGQPGPEPVRSSCLVLALGLLAGYGIQRLSAGARRTCRLLLREHPGFFDLWTWEPVLTVAAVAAIGLVAWWTTALATRRTRRLRLRRAAPVVAMTATFTALALLHFAFVGTPAEAARDIVLCSDDNVPPWWPSWLPD